MNAILSPSVRPAAALGDDRLPERFWAKITISERGCWEWTASLDDNGYARFALHSRNIHKAHRLAYTALIGPIPKGLVLDHLCRVRHCVNPVHLEPVTQRENVLRSPLTSARIPRRADLEGISAHCGKDHPRTEANTHIRPNGYPQCLVCHRKNQQRYAARKAAERRVAREGGGVR